MRITSKGQVTIPRDIRVRLGFLPGTEVEFAISGESIYLRKSNKARRGGGRTVVNALRGTATARMSTKTITALTRS
jgi:AbrB family looped-hinge helix DNA binding protein